MFDANGNFQRSIGRAGDGPGEFRAIYAIDINGSKEIVTFDPGNKRITRFSNTGEVSASYAPAEGAVIWPRDVRWMSENRYLLLQEDCRV